jgi:signal transduction histidine kinase
MTSGSSAGMESSQALQEQLEWLHSLSVEIASLRDMREVYDRALARCLELTSSQMGFVDLLEADREAMDVVAVRGFVPSDPGFYERNRRMPVRPSVFGIVIVEERPHISNDVEHDPFHIGTPMGHPVVRTFLGVPLQVGTVVIGMIGVANKPGGYDADDERLLGTFANQVAVAIDNASLYERQRAMISGLQQLHQRLDDVERDQLLGHERERIAAGLHDDIEQSVFTIGMRLNALLERDLEPATAAQLQDVRHQVSRVSDRVRDVVFALSAPGHEGGDLASSMRSLLRETARTSGIKTDLVVSGTEPAGISAVQDALYAVVREALTNVAKHAHAQTVLVSLRYTDDRCDVVVQDDGVGAPKQVLHTFEDSYVHYGLRHMRRKIHDAGGSFEVANGEEGGLVLTVRVPVPERT